jgi:hypothetical protein
VGIVLDMVDLDMVVLVVGMLVVVAHNILVVALVAYNQLLDHYVTVHERYSKSHRLLVPVEVQLDCFHHMET